MTTESKIDVTGAPPVRSSAWLAAVSNLESEFSRFVAGKRITTGIGGQTIGQEGYILRFSGFHEAAVWDAIAAVRKAANDKDQRP